MRRTLLAAFALGLLAGLGGCGNVHVKPQPVLPRALIVPLPTRVALVVPKDVRGYIHKETRWGVDWDVDLGTGHRLLLHYLFAAQFREVVESVDLDAARKLEGVRAIFEPHIDQFAFTTSRETGRYYAVTIRYRIDVYTSAGELTDSYALTGYGNCLASRIGSARPLEVATASAMRDAAAKFLVQFPELAAGKHLAHDEALVAEKPALDASEIAAVPIEAADGGPPVPAASDAPSPQPGPSQPAPAAAPARSLR